MLPKERRDSGQNDLFKSHLDQIVDMNHALAKLARKIDWGFLEGKFGAVYADVPDRPPLPTRLILESRRQSGETDTIGWLKSRSFLSW